MQQSTGALRPRISSNATRPLWLSGPSGVALLLGLGVLLALSHSLLRAPDHLHLPGHHGVIEIALLLGACMVARGRWSASVVAIGAAATSMVPGFEAGGATAAFYLLCGLTVDLGYRAVPDARRGVLALMLIGAAANAVRPLARWLIMAAGGAQFESLSHGLAWPLWSHAAFGVIGAMVAVGAAQLIARRR